MKTKKVCKNFLTDRGIILPVPYWIELTLFILLLFFSHEFFGNTVFILTVFLTVILFLFFHQKNQKGESNE